MMDGENGRAETLKAELMKGVGIGETFVSGGVAGIWETWQALVSLQRDEVIEQFDAERRAQEATPVGSDAAADDPQLWATARESWDSRREAQLERVEVQRSRPAPVWRLVSGLDEDEFAISPGERAGQIRKLLRGVERVARAELRAEEVRCGGDWRAFQSVEENGERDGRAFGWDPLRSICYYFGIAKTKLGAYAWEIWGLSAPQLVDRVKCEAVRGKIRAEVKEFLLKYCAEHANAETEDAWDALRAARKGLSQRTALAARLGFSSYSRYFRACVLCHGMEPGALEREVFEEVVNERPRSEVESPKSGEPGAVVKREGMIDDLRLTNDDCGQVGRESGGG